MIQMKLNYNEVLPFIKDINIDETTTRLAQAYSDLISKNGRGNDFLGWLDLPDVFSTPLIDEIEKCAEYLSFLAEVVVVIGIGGSYLGARAVIEALQPYFPLTKKGNKENPQILYAGNSVSETYLADLLNYIENKSFAIVVISKSGTTTEPALAFRILKEACEKKYGKKGATSRIVAITDEKKGVLKSIAEQEHYTSFVIPDDVGGRYSVLTPVGLLPIALAGFSIRKLLEGALKMKKQLYSTSLWEENPAMQYALLRYLLYTQKNKKVELLVTYEPKLFYFIEWFKQLFGESEGKELKGIFPAGAVFTTDLHSLGQYIQEGERFLFETILSVEKSERSVEIPYLQNDEDKLNYLQHRTIQEINLIAEEGTRKAHLDGGVPLFTISIPSIQEETIGELLYFFQFSCALGGYLLSINPFDQPGVEAYKTNMFKLLGKF